MIKDNIKSVRERMEAACKRAGRDISEVTLINVSKTKPLSDLMEAYEAGERIFGENKVQEISEKFPAMPSDVRWHMIGHLQRNKVKYIIDRVELIHSVDSLRLAETISEEALKKGITADILIEVNVAGEETKFGIDTDSTLLLVKEIAKLPGIRIRGLMTIAPYVDVPEENRTIFRALKKLSVDIEKQNIDNVYMGVLSMGMTGDFEVAIEEGATMIRVGTAIFGSR